MRKPFAIAVAALTSAAAFSATNLPPVIVEASRIRDEVRAFPASVSVFTGEDISASDAKSLDDFLQRRAGVQIRHMNSNPLQASLAMRGYGESSFGRVLVLVNGERLNNPDMEAPNLTRVPLSSVSRIEVLRGPQTVRFGDAASAGVVNIITDDAPMEERTVLRASGGSYGTFGAAARRSGGLVDDGDAGYVASYAAGLDFQSSEGYRDNSAYRIWNADAAVRLASPDGFRALLVSAFFDRGFYEMPGALSEALYRSAPREAANGDATRDEADVASFGGAARLTTEAADGDRNELEVAASRRYRDVDWRGAYASRYDYDSWSATLSDRAVFSGTAFGRDNKFLVGGDFSFDDYGVASKSSFGNGDDDYRRFAFAAYAEDELQLADTLSLTVGGRLERFLSKWSGALDEHWSWNEGAWEVGLNWTPNDALRLFTRFDRFYRAPFCDEMNYVAPGDKLEPESGWSVDAGADLQVAEESVLSLTFFRTVTDDEIFYNPYADESLGYWTGYNENSPAETERMGVELAASWEREDVASLRAAYSYTDARFNEGEFRDKAVPLVPRNALSLLGEVWVLEEVALGAGVRAYDGQRFGSDFGNAHGSLPGYAVADFSVKYRPARDGWLTIVAAVDNVFDKKYCDYAGWSDFSGRYYYPAAGRCFSLSAKAEF